MKYVHGQKKIFQNTPLLKRIRKLIFHLVSWVKTCPKLANGLDRTKRILSDTERIHRMRN